MPAYRYRFGAFGVMLASPVLTDLRCARHGFVKAEQIRLDEGLEREIKFHP